MRRLAPAAALLLLAACVRETPVHLEDRNLGIAATFPGQPRMNKYTEPTPYGEMEWFSTVYSPAPRLDRSYFIEVGNLPPGDRGGTTEAQVLTTYKAFLRRKMGQIETTDVAPDTFRYTAHLPSGDYAEGLVVVRRGRLHRAQATAPRADDPRLRGFMESFRVMP